jgi:hypothetical protein
MWTKYRVLASNLEVYIVNKMLFKVLKTPWLRRLTDTCSGTARAPDMSSFWWSVAQCMDSHRAINRGICGSCPLLFCQWRLLVSVGTALQRLNSHHSLVCNVLGWILNRCKRDKLNICVLITKSLLISAWQATVIMKQSVVSAGTHFLI